MTLVWLTIVALAVVVAAEGVALLALARELAMMSRRLPDPEALDLDGGPDIGSSLRGFTTSALGDVTPRPLETRETLLMFVSGTCEPCRALMRDMHLIAQDWPDVRLLPVVSGTEADARLLQRQAPKWTGPILVDSSQQMKRLNVPVTPFGLALNSELNVTARGIVNGRDSAAAVLEGRIRVTAPHEWELAPLEDDSTRQHIELTEHAPHAR